MPSICINCVKHVTLKQLIEEHGSDDIECDVCHGVRKAIDASNNLFQQLFKALIRFHYNEWEYNPHLGGDSFESIFQLDNPIFELRNRKSRNEDGFSSILEAATENAYEDYDRGVSLYSGYSGAGVPAGILRSIKSETHPALENIAARLKSENYFNVEDEMRSIVINYKGVIDTKIPADSRFFRARIGFKDKKTPLDLSFEHHYHFEPFTESEIAAPPPHSARSGRINRHGVSFFYAATDSKTAISEVRPHPGDIVSIGCFKTTKPLLMADFTETRIEHFSGSDRLLDDFLTIHSINIYLNKIVPPSERDHYSVTQLIADTIRQLGYEGIMFLSTVGNGHNIVVFHPELLEYEHQKGQVFEVQNLDYTIREREIIRDINGYI